MQNSFKNCLNKSFLKEQKQKTQICDFCHKKIYLDDMNCYYFQIFGLGKHDKKIICYQCFKNKMTNYSK